MKDKKTYIRTFIALDLPETIKTGIYNCYQDLASRESKAIKWTIRENLHLTLKFLGDTEETSLPLIKQVLENRKEKIPFQLALLGQGTFPDNRQPGVFWVSFQEPDTVRLREEQKRLEEELSGYGIPKENKEFFPHITVARLKLFTQKDRQLFDRAREKFTDAFNNMKKPLFEINELTLFKSELRPKGAVYIKLYSI